MILREPFRKRQRPVLVSIVAENRTSCSLKKSSVVKSQGREARARACKSIRHVFYAFGSDVREYLFIRTKRKCPSESLSCIDTQNRTKTTAERCQKMHRRDGISLVSCLPILAVCRSRHSSQTCIGIGRFRMQADVLVTSTPKSKISKSGPLYYRFGAICGLLRWSSKR